MSLCPYALLFQCLPCHCVVLYLCPVSVSMFYLTIDLYNLKIFVLYERLCAFLMNYSITHWCPIQINSHIAICVIRHPYPGFYVSSYTCTYIVLYLHLTPISVQPSRTRNECIHGQLNMHLCLSKMERKLLDMVLEVCNADQ